MDTTTDASTVKHFIYYYSTGFPFFLRRYVREGQLLVEERFEILRNNDVVGHTSSIFWQKGVDNEEEIEERREMSHENITRIAREQYEAGS